MIKQGESLFIPFIKGEGVPDAHYKARTYKTVEACRKALKRDFDKVEVVEYAPAKRGEWISVKDRLPEEEKEVLCYLGNALGKGIVVAFRRHGDWYFDGWKCPTVTHWMLLPEPPKEDE
jgi:hypothetical protein